MTKIEANMEIEKETKNTYRFSTVSGGQPEGLGEIVGVPPAVGTIYVGKHGFQGETPRRVKVTVEW